MLVFLDSLRLTLLHTQLFKLTSFSEILDATCVERFKIRNFTVAKLRVLP